MVLCLLDPQFTAGARHFNFMDFQPGSPGFSPGFSLSGAANRHSAGRKRRERG